MTPSVSGQTLTFTATVSITTPGGSALGNPTGTVSFYDGGTLIGQGTLSGASTDTAKFTTGSLLAGTHPITAQYTSGDANFNASPVSPPISQVVNQAKTTTTVVSSGNPSVSGQSVTFTATVHVGTPGSFTAAYPTGTVTFYDNGLAIGTGTLTATSGGVATLLTSTLRLGQHPITAQYTRGDTNFSASTAPSAKITQTVNKASTTTTVTSSVNPSVLGQSVIFTATVSVTTPGSTAAAYPTGTVTFYDNNTVIGTGKLSTASGVTTANFTTSTLSLGQHSITARYTSGDGNFNASATSPAITETLTKASATTAVVSSGYSSVSGQSVTFTATVSPAANALGIPTGTVTFYDGAAPIGTAALSGGSTDTATYATSILSVGTHQITAVYNGDANFNASTQPSPPISQAVNQAGTTTAVASSANPSAFGQNVTLTATVSVASPGSTAAAFPTGTVTFYDNNTAIGTEPLSTTSGVTTATLASSGLGFGAQQITAAYTSGDGNFLASAPSPPISQIVKANTATAVVSSANPSDFGQGVTFTATVSVTSPGGEALGNPTGIVDFYDGGTLIGQGDLTGAGTDTATFTTSTLSVGAHAITAAYTSGDGNFLASLASPSISQTVNRAGTTTAVASSPNPSAFGQNVTLTATVSVASPGSTAAASPTGAVTFYDNGIAIGTGALTATSGGVATFTTSTLSVGTHQITAAYTVGDANFLASAPAAAISQTVSQASTTTVVASSTNPSTFDENVTFTATVTVASPGSTAAANPTGTVTFFDNGNPIGSGTLSTGGGVTTASLTTSTLNVGTHPITASYSGDGNFNASAPSSAITQTVNMANTTTVVVSSANPSALGQSVTFTATVSVVNLGSKAAVFPTGTVTFYDNLIAIGTGPLSTTSGVTTANFTTSALGLGTHPITAQYSSGDANFNASGQSGALNEVVPFTFRLGSTGSDYGLAVTTDAAGYLYVTGSFSGIVNFNPNGSPGNLTARGSNDAFVAKYDATSRALIWATDMGGSGGTVGRAIAVDGLGNVYTTGSFTGTTDFDPGSGVFNLTSAGSSDVFVSKLSSTGSLTWADRMGGSGTDVGYGIAVDGSGNVYTTGYFSGTADFDPGTGVFNLTSAGSDDVFVSKLSSAGGFVWADRMGGSGIDSGFGIAVDGLGNVYTTGYFSGTADFDPGTSVFNLTSAGSTDVFVSKLTGPGALAQRLAAGTPESETAGPLLTTQLLQPIVAQAIANWAAAGLDPRYVKMMSQVDVEVGDLSSSYLGLAVPNQVTISPNAGGAGWFIDAAPDSNSAFVATSPGRDLIAAPGSPAYGRVDLLTVVEHELGHTFGFDESPDPTDVMAEYLGTGERRLPTAADVQMLGLPSAKLAPASSALAEGPERRAAAAIALAAPIIRNETPDLSPLDAVFAATWGWVPPHRTAHSGASSPFWY